MKKQWPSWLKWGVIGLIVGSMHPIILLLGGSLDGSGFLTFLTAIGTLLSVVPVTVVEILSPGSSFGGASILAAPIFYMGVGMLFGHIIRRRKRKEVAAATIWTSEANIASMLGDYATGNQVVGGSNIQASFPMSFPMEEMNIRVYRDADESIGNFKTFDFDYINKANPLLEKELFKQLEKELQKHGLARAAKDPQITISMDFFIGKREQYTPPNTVINTELKYDWNFGEIGGNWGGFSSTVPITKSSTTPGYTTTSYYSNIRLNFLNHAKLAKGLKPEIPPLIWVGEADSDGLSQDIRGIAAVMFGELMGEFPGPSTKPSKRYAQHFIYGGLGLGFDVANWSIINFVEPLSVAAELGIKAGDNILAINGGRVGNWPSYNRWQASNPAFYRSRDPYFQYILSNRGDAEVELVIRAAETGKKVTLKMKPRTIDRYVQVTIDSPFKKIAKGNTLGGVIGIMIVIAVVLYFIYFVF